MHLCNTAQIRRADALMMGEHGFPGLLLMEAAGRKAAEWILEHQGDRLLYYVLVGPGNNGGDGLVVARYLRAAGKRVELLLSHAPDRFQGDAATNWAALGGSGIPWQQWPASFPSELKLELEPKLEQPPAHCLLIDSLLGTGVQAALQGPVAEIVAALSGAAVDCVAIDLPSGLDADTGRIGNPCIPAIATVTFQAPKVCHHVHPAAGRCGDIVVADIGIWPHVMARLGIKRQLLDAAWCRAHYQRRPLDGHKGSFGHALVVGGSRQYAGAAGMSGMAALQAGAGLATVFTTESARCAVFAGRPELMVQGWGTAETPCLTEAALPSLQACLAGKTALALGPGLGNAPETNRFVAGLLQAWARPLVIDADGLNVLSSDPELWRYVPPYSILTPHPGEMARLLPGKDVLHQRLECAEHLAQLKQVVVVLKGPGTVVALPDGRTFVNTTGNAGMATGGSGDVLTGLLAGLLAQGYPPEVAACMGVCLHGRAGDLAKARLGAEEAVTASAIGEAIGAAFHELTPH